MAPFDDKLAPFPPLRICIQTLKEMLQVVVGKSCEVMIVCQGHARPRTRQAKQEHVGRGRRCTGLRGRRNKDGGHAVIWGTRDVASVPEAFQVAVASRAPALGSPGGPHQGFEVEPPTRASK